MPRWLTHVRSFGADSDGASRFARLISGVPVRSALLQATEWQPPHPEDVPAVIGHVETAWSDAATGDVLAVLAFNTTAQARLVDHAMRPWQRASGVTRYGCAVMALTRKTGAGPVVALSTVTVDLVAYDGAAGTVLRPLADDEPPMPLTSTREGNS